MKILRKHLWVTNTSFSLKTKDLRYFLPLLTPKNWLCLVFCLSLCPILWAQPSASFEYNFDDGTGLPCSPTTLNLSNTSTGNIIGYSWSMNGQFFSTNENPINNIPVGGDYTICLEVTDANNVTNESCQVISTFDPPQIEINVNENNDVCLPYALTYSISSNVPLDSLRIDYGDGSIQELSGNSSTFLQLTHTYVNAGTFSLIITAYEENGCFATEVAQDIVTLAEVPMVDFQADATSSCTVPLEVNFNNFTSPSSGLDYQWDFGDGTTDTGINPTHTYLNEGLFDVQLIATNPVSGCTDTLLVDNYISVGNSAAEFNYEIIDNGDCSETTVKFSSLATGNITSVIWDFGDGNSSIDLNPTHTYSVVGCYTATFTINTADGCEATTSTEDCIGVNGAVDATYTTTGDLSGCNIEDGLTVNFFGESSTATSYLWNFGELGSSELQNPSFTFQSYGSFPVSMTAFFPNGCSMSVVEETIVLAPISPTFRADVENGCAPLSVNFEDLTATDDPIATYLWDFGNGITSTLAAPNVVYADTGAYDVQLIVTTQGGCKDTLIIEDYIEVGMPPNVAFSADPLITCASEEIEFTDLSDEIADEWEWHFGDGNTSEEQNATHTYQDTGYFDIQLIASFNGCADTTIIEDYILIYPPVAKFSIDRTCGSKEVGFVNTSIGADSWEWDFGDGNSSTDWEPTHTFDEFGEYLISLTVYNDLTGCEDVKRIPVTVMKAFPDFSISPLLLCANETIEVTNNSINAVSYEWIFPSEVGIIENGVLNDNPLFIAPFPGEWTGFGLTVTDITGCEYSIMIDDTIRVSGVDAMFEIASATNCMPLEVSFTDLSTSNITDPVSYFWDFGDGNTSTEQHPVHNYTANGIFTVKLTVKNDLGCSDTYILENGIIAGDPETNFFVQQSDCEGLEMEFLNTTISNNIPTYIWDFGDGTTSTTTSPKHTYSTVGDYYVCLTATTNQDCAITYCDSISVSPMSIEFEGDNVYTSCYNPPLVTNFTDLSTGATSWIWTFGDNTGNSTLQNPSHSYSQVGLYDVCLTITNDYGCRETLCKEEYIQVEGPTGSFSFSPNEGCTELEVEFIAEAENVVKYTWDFGDGNGLVNFNTNDTDTVSYVYKQGGTFLPSVLIQDATGCTISIEATDPIVVNAVDFDFDNTPAEFCAGNILPINFSSDINTNDNIVSIEWQFPGSNTPTSTEPNPANILYETAGIYDVSLTVTTDLCATTITKDSVVVIHPQPQAYFNYTPQTICAQQEFTFFNNSNGDFISQNWSIDGVNIGDTSVIKHVFEEAGTYIVNLEIANEEGCTSSFSDTLQIQDAIEIELGDELIVCKNAIATLSTNVVSEGSLSYEWSPITNLSCFDCPNPTVKATEDITYYLLVRNEFGCLAEDSIRITLNEHAAPEISISNDTTVCVGQLVTLLASGGDDIFDYQWDTTRLGLSCYENCFNPIAQPATTTTYVLTVSNDHCISQDSVTVEISDSELEILVEEQTICEGDSVRLEVLDGSDPVWDYEESLSCTNCPNPVAQPTVTTTYNVQVTGPSGCLLSDEITINVLRPEDVFAGDDQAICLGDSIQLNSDFDGQVIWVNEGQIISIDESMLTVYPESNTVYQLSVTQGGCTLTDALHVEVYESAEVFTEDYLICEGESVQLEVSGIATDFVWEQHTDLTINGSSATARPTTTSTYTVIGTADSCTPDTAFVTVEVIDNPVIDVVQNNPFTIGDEIQLDAQVQGSGNYTYEWTPPYQLSCSNCPNPIVTPDSTMVYQLYVTDEFGCQDSIAVSFRELLICEDNSIVVPSAFTPNDDGNNDEFFIRGSAEFKLLRIFNRWGEMVFETSNPNNGWDGTYKGELLNRDVFVYYVEALCKINGETIIKSGDVTLLR